MNIINVWQDKHEVTTHKTEKVLVLIPTFNEVGNIEDILEKIRNTEWILVVDDGSSDGTVEKLRVLQNLKKYNNLFVFRRPSQNGYGSAIRDGFNFALKSFAFSRLVQIDADLSHDPDLIHDLVSCEADIVIGSRYVKHGGIKDWTTFRIFLSIGANFLAKNLLRLKVKDSTSGFKAYSRRAIKILYKNTKCKGYEFQVETVWLAQKLGLTLMEFPIIFRNRSSGESKLKFFKEISHFLLFILNCLTSTTAKNLN